MGATVREVGEKQAMVWSVRECFAGRMVQKVEVGTTPELTTFDRMGAACVGSALVALTMTPLDVAKIRLQATENPVVSTPPCHVKNPRCRDFIIRDGICEIRELKSKWPRWFHNHILAHSQPSQRTMRHVLRTTFKEEGICALYAGVVPTIAMSVPNNVLYFAAYERIRDVLAESDLGLGSVAPIISGSSARMAATAVTAPLEFVRTQRQAGMSIRDIRGHVSNGGVLSLWKGVVPTLWRDVPFSAVYWYMYETLKVSLPIKDGNVKAFVAGGLSGVVSAFATMPFDVVKTRVQVEMSCGAQNPGLYGCLHHIVQKEGVTSLFSGLLPRVLRAGPSCAIMIASYETVKSYILAQHQATLAAKA